MRHRGILEPAAHLLPPPPCTQLGTPASSPPSRKERQVSGRNSLRGILWCPCCIFLSASCWTATWGQHLLHLHSLYSPLQGQLSHPSFLDRPAKSFNLTDWILLPMLFSKKYPVRKAPTIITILLNHVIQMEDNCSPPSPPLPSETDFMLDKNDACGLNAHVPALQAASRFTFPVVYLLQSAFLA